jgi:hypothetical protein
LVLENSGRSGLIGLRFSKNGVGTGYARILGKSDLAITLAILQKKKKWLAGRSGKISENRVGSVVV